MDSLTFFPLLVLLFWMSLRFNLRRRRNLPPGPFPFPIIGNILQLGSNPHRSLATLSQTYGPIMSLQLGSIYTVVVSSPSAAKQVMQEHDHVFSGRTIPAAAEAHRFHENSMAFLPVGTRWRKVRKICREHIFAVSRLDASRGIRREKMRHLCKYVQRCCELGRAVNIWEAAFVTSLNLTTATLFSVDFTDFDSDATHDLMETVGGVTKIFGSPNVGDFFPVLKVMDPQGIRRKSDYYLGKLFDVFEVIIKERMESRRASEKRSSDFLEALLDLMEGSEYELSINDIKNLLMDLYLGGSHTTSTTMEWAMTELLLNPKTMATAKNELTSVIGDKKQVEESDITKLPYLQSVMKETFRLHPAVPLLVPRRAGYEAQINGFTIPKDTQILVNSWAIGRDPRVWPNPTSFEPDRFLNSKIEFKGQDFGLIPFGSGRRICPGLMLADRMVHLTVASLIHNFDWKLPPGEDVDTAEKFGMTLPKAVSLMAIPICKNYS